MKFEVLLAMGKELWLACFENFKKRANKVIKVFLAAKDNVVCLPFLLAESRLTI